MSFADSDSSIVVSVEMEVEALAMSRPETQEVDVIVGSNIMGIKETCT